MSENALFSKVYGCLIGGCIGDAMGQPVEGKTFREIENEIGRVEDFEGAGTDDSLLKHLLCQAIFDGNGYVTTDHWARVWRREMGKPEVYRWLYIPVRNAWKKLHAEKLKPRECGAGNMASSSSAMCIAPMGIINAGSPREAMLEAWQVASIIHHNFCRDAAAVLAAAIAEAFRPEATVDSVLSECVRYLPDESGSIFLESFEKVMELAERSGDYEDFRRVMQDEYFDPSWDICDSRDTVPSTLALFKLSNGDPKTAILYGANYGRDTDTIANMVGGLAGAFSGSTAFPGSWIEKVEGETDVKQRELAEKLTEVLIRRLSDRMRAAESLRSLT